LGHVLTATVCHFAKQLIRLKFVFNTIVKIRRSNSHVDMFSVA